LFVEEGNIDLTHGDVRISTKKKDDEFAYHDYDGDKGFCKNCNFQPFILMVAMSFHSIFEGLALGLNLNATVAVDLMISVLLHKYAEGMSLSISL